MCRHKKKKIKTNQIKKFRELYKTTINNRTENKEDFELPFPLNCN